MNTVEKIELLNALEETEQLSSDDHFEILKKLSRDSDEDIRFRVAYIISSFHNESSKNVLIELAKDKDHLVRIEAYDCLSTYYYKDVERLLKKAIRKEKICALACFYAVKSWADVTCELYDITSGQLKYIQTLQKSKRFYRSERCQLALCYAEYVLGNDDALKKLFKYLRHKNTDLRSSAVMLLMQILYEDNYEMIEREIDSLSKREKSKSVKYSILDFEDKKAWLHMQIDH